MEYFYKFKKTQELPWVCTLVPPPYFDRQLLERSKCGGGTKVHNHGNITMHNVCRSNKISKSNFQLKDSKSGQRPEITICRAAPCTRIIDFILEIFQDFFEIEIWIYIYSSCFMKYLQFSFHYFHVWEGIFFLF